MKPVSHQILDLMADFEPRTAAAVARELNLRTATVSDSMSSLYQSEKLYVHSWAKAGNATIRCYGYGIGDDAVRPLAIRKNTSVDDAIRQDLLAQGRPPFDPANPRCDVAASWIRSKA